MTPRWILLAALALAAPAMAQDAPPTREDVMAIAADKNIKLKMDKLTGAINASQFQWTYEDVYTLVDMEHPPEVTKPAAAKAGMFYDNPKSLSSIIKAGRESARPEAIKISSNADFVIVFETFNDFKYAIEAANRKAESIDPRKSHESDNDWFLRKRKAEEARLAEVSPIEGKISNTTFEAELTGSVIEDGGCNKPRVTIDLEKIDFGLYRYTLGGKQVDLPMALAGASVEKVGFLASGGRRFEATGTCTKAAPGSPAKLSLRMHRPFDSDQWSGTAEFK